MDELCVRLTPSLWLWVAASREVGQVLGFAFGRRDRDTLALCWSDVPADYKDKPIVTDGYAAYTGFFDPDQHRAIDKGGGEIGETSIVESLNTKWRQRQSGYCQINFRSNWQRGLVAYQGAGRTKGGVQGTFTTACSGRSKYPTRRTAVLAVAGSSLPALDAVPDGRTSRSGPEQTGTVAPGQRT